MTHDRVPSFVRVSSAVSSQKRSWHPTILYDRLEREGPQSDEWEDVSESADGDTDRGSTSPVRRMRVASPSHSMALRKRKPALPPPLSPKKIRFPAKPKPELRRTEKHDASSSFTDGIQMIGAGLLSLLLYAVDVIWLAIRIIKPAIAFLLAGCFLILILVWASTTMIMISPVCKIPGSSHIFSMCGLPSAPAPQSADFPALVAIQSKTFDKMLEESVGGSTLSLEIKKSEIATKDLITLVKVSELKTREAISESLFNFVHDAKLTSEGLQKLSSHVRFTVDGVVAVNNHALATIDAARNDHAAAITAPWYKLWKIPILDTEGIVLKKFTESMDYLSDSVERLIIEGQVQKKNLADLEAHLDVLAELVSREDVSISSEREEILALLWTRLGRNKATIRRFDSGLTLLKAVTGYRKAALAHVVSAMHTLEVIKSDLEVIRERVGAPAIVGSSIPVEIHMQSIQAGLIQLKESSQRAKERERKTMDKFISL